MKKSMAILFLVVICLPLYSQNETATAVCAVIKWDKTSHNFDNVEFNKPARATFTLTNVGTIPAQILSVQHGYNCSVLSYPIKPVPPGQTAKIEVEFDAKLVGYFSKLIRIKMNTEPSLNELHIAGEVRDITLE